MCIRDSHSKTGRKERANKMETEYFFSIGNIIISLSGTTGNILSLLCMWKLGRIRKDANNADKLLIALNMIDLFQCTIVLPYQVSTYLKPGSRSSFLYTYFTAVGFWFSSFMVFLIALNRYIKISKPSRYHICLLYTSPSPRDGLLSRMPSSA